MTHLPSFVRLFMVALALGVVGCSQPTTSSTSDSGSVDASATPDAPGSDAPGADAFSTVDAATADAASTDDAGTCNTCLNDALAWGTDGGRVCTRDGSELSPCRDYTHERVAVACDPPDRSCMNELPCEGIDAVLAADVVEALAHPDVVAAIAAAPVLYGTDPRPVDGVVEWFTVGGGERVEVGDGSVPAGVSALMTLLHRIDDQQIAAPGCVEVFPPT